MAIGVAAAVPAAASDASSRIAPLAKIAFASDEDDPLADIWVMNVDGSGRRNLTPGRPGLDTQPSWSPDGARIAFTTVAADGSWDLWLMNADGSDLRRITTDPARDSNPTWSPDGTKILFRSERSGNSDIWVMNADGSQAQQLTDDPSFEGHPDYSPDGTRIVFDRRPPTALFTMTAEGRNVRQITPDSLFALDAAWSPRGNRLVFTNGFCGPCQFNDLVSVNPVGRRVVQLTNDTDARVNLNANWSPDGRKIVFDSQPITFDSPPDLHVINDDGSGRTNITRTPEIAEATPDWWAPVAAHQK
jgi:Tol biopolymer transport system component